MTKTTNTIIATAPDYAPEGSRGYHLETATGIHGWANLGDDGRTVWATLNTEPYFVVGTVTDWTEFTPEWIAEHAEMITEG
jgi:hypothetical protein